MWRSYEAKMLRTIAEGLGAKGLPTYEELIRVNEKPAMTTDEVAQQRRRLLEGLNAG